MVLATGSELVNDIRKAPDDVLSRAERINDVCSFCVQNGAPILKKDYLARSARIHARLTHCFRHALLERNSFQINAGYCRYFQ